MRVALIIPPSLFLSDERVFMHLGVLRIAAVLEHAYIPVDVLDFSGVANYLEALRAYCQAIKQPIVFGITATSPQIPATTQIAEYVRTLLPDSKIILGGPHVTLVHAAYKKELERKESGRAHHALQQLANRVDTIVAGDGEEAIFQAINEKGSQIIDADNRSSSLFLQKKQLTALPFPARHLVDVASYRYCINNVPALSMIAQLGCPFNCGFCGGRNSDFLRIVRLRPTENVIAEMRHIYEKYHIRGIMFYDDELNVNKQIIELMNAIAHLGKELNIDWKLRGFVKAELFTDEQAEAMYKAGFREILTGFESGSPRILTNINKRATKEDNTRCAKIARKHGLRVKALMSIGHPGETETTIKETKDWILEIQPDSFDLTRITVYPGSPYFDAALPHANQEGIWVYTASSGDRLYSREVNYLTDYLYYKGDKGDRAGLNKFFAYTDALSVNDLAQLRDETEKELREALNQPYQTDAPSRQFDHSMGQGLPEYILKSSEKAQKNF